MFLDIIRRHPVFISERTVLQAGFCLCLLLLSWSRSVELVPIFRDRVSDDRMMDNVQKHNIGIMRNSLAVLHSMPVVTCPLKVKAAVS
jgi:hypothetical protein